MPPDRTVVIRGRRGVPPNVSGPGAMAQEVRLRSGWELLVVRLPGLWAETWMVWYGHHIDFFSCGLKLWDQDLEWIAVVTKWK